jgi:RNA polymerase sigma factor (sigma-70 family)
LSRRSSDFEFLVREHARVMASAVRRVCGPRHRDLVEDVEQEVYLALWKRLERGKPIEHPISYLYKMALTTALAVVRRQRTTLSFEERDPLEAAGAQEGADPHALQPVERHRLIDELVESLRPEEARALRAWLAGFGHREIAELYGWSESVARHRVYRSLERLRSEEDERSRAARPTGDEGVPGT